MDDKLIEKIEALLFASGKPLNVETLINILDYDNKKNILSSLKKLKESYDQRKSPLMVVEHDSLWKLTVREEFLPLVRKIVADTELSKTILETLAVIAWKSPVLQSTVIKVRTNKAYEHIDVLEKMGFISRKKQGRSFKISLSEKFYEYFDVQHGDIRKMFNDVKGIEKELEEEQQKHQGKDGSEDESVSSEKIVNLDDDNDISQALDAEKPHLGSLEVVDSISSDAPESVEIVDALDSSNETDEISPSVKVDKFQEAEEKDIDEVLEDLDEEKKSIDEVKEILEDSIVSDDDD